MQHPILKSFKSVVFYFATWIAFAFLNSLFLYYKLNFGFSISLISCFIFNISFSLFGIAIWYTVVFSFPEKTGIFNLIINHLTTVVLLLIVWIFGSSFIIGQIAGISVHNFVIEHIFWFIIAGLAYYAILILVFYIIIYNNNLKERKKSEDKLLARVKEAELSMLKSQINPHFLFNSLNSISSLTITNPLKAQEMIINLSDFLRYSISGHGLPKTNLITELENLQRYLDIEKIRFGSRLAYSQNVPDNCLHAAIPVMILQPLYENAIKHGVYESTETINIDVSCRLENQFLIISIKNNFDPESPSKKGSGIGLKNIRERLRLIYHNEGLMQIEKTDNTFEVKLIIPQNE